MVVRRDALPQQSVQGGAGWFRSAVDNRLRAGWRIAAFLAVLYAVALPILFGLRALLGFSKSSPLVIVIIAASATSAVYIARRWIDGKSLKSLGLHGGIRSAADVAFGFLLSGVMAGLVFAAMLALGFIGNVEAVAFDWSFAGVLAGSLIVMALVGFWEELVFRGYVLQNMAEGMGMKTAIIVSCALYGLVHSANPNAGILSTAIIVLFGYLRIYGYLSTGQLWLSIGMHTGWNFFQATVFGFAASGHAEARTWLTHDALSPDWLSGGDFGPEASVLTIPVVLIALVVMRWWSRTRIPGAVGRHPDQ
jgi:membrane protease YdiL (CAAX protease family)